MTTEPRKFIRLVGGEAGWDFWMAMAIAGTLQLGLMLYLRRANRKFSRVLALFAALFLLVTVLTGIRHDYIVKVQIWNVVRQLGTPWWSSDEWGLQNVVWPAVQPVRLSHADQHSGAEGSVRLCLCDLRHLDGEFRARSSAVGGGRCLASEPAPLVIGGGFRPFRCAHRLIVRRRGSRTADPGATRWLAAPSRRAFS